MTQSVTISITSQAGNGQPETVQHAIRTEHFEEDMKELIRKVTQTAGVQALQGFEADLRSHELRQAKVLRSEERRYQFQDFSLRYKRRTYQQPDGSIHKPLDKLLGFEKYQRRSWRAREQTGVLAAATSYRMAAAVESSINSTAISPATVCREVRRVGMRVAEQDRQFQATEPGKIKAPVLYGEADGVWISLQKEKQRRVEVRVAIAYSGKKFISSQKRMLLDKMTLTSVGVPSSVWQEMLREKLYSHYDLEKTRLLVVGGDGSEWVSNSFDLVGVAHMERVLDPYHVVRAVSNAFAGVLAIKPILNKLFSEGFGAVETELLKVVAPGSKAAVRSRIDCLQYLRNHANELRALAFRQLHNLPHASLGAIESNVGKLVAQRMKTRGVSWSLDGASAMLAILSHKQELTEHVFHYQALRKQSKNRRSKPDTTRVHAAGFPILRSGKMSTPYASLFRNIIHADIPL